MGKNEAVVDPDTPDDESPELTEEDFARMKPVWAYPELVEFLRKSGKLPSAGPDRVAVTLRLVPEILAQLRKAEGGWEDYANALLRKGLGWDDR